MPAVHPAPSVAVGGHQMQAAAGLGGEVGLGEPRRPVTRVGDKAQQILAASHQP
jgi:hypothetical protein